MATSDNYTSAFLEEQGDALYIRVRAVPGARRSGVAGVYGGPHGSALRVAVSVPPERGKANRAICRVLAEVLGVRPSQVSVQSGETSRDKKLRVDRLGRSEAERRLRDAGSV